MLCNLIGPGARSAEFADRTGSGPNCVSACGRVYMSYRTDGADGTYDGSWDIALIERYRFRTSVTL
jgi:hypothetical protein